ncbi:N-acetylmuramoyl-L-alanine amidase [Clostridium pasteurianum DSM 525 = ATCC 6013]|uniref:Cell wall hydrolase/autolysin n=1 Tax=Clostridium pasteurianum DSM 525 = ATCC 6013 TaxID=1262449 RepID=A0A0H3JAG1_CLOPA|nr:N-acetylmuramoyl-L-alanine amidase [Clostridium pasteurianum]AJA49518.1 N-acetylmuramoyl-L-alanine amidase [Clostridium pasteurianum DSM 525 = ATCC 6013]AJA53506.1 N-acetylmuramoyl-L-alanine amidase [Clostridium pasteurianum DSM 525 = ATCC 6013]AOZ76679.1 hypothetical protein AQ983_16795 [Clostridium pasteurianum DSM 525 = ATCC 6013]AOZ80476.1 hypothetical protein AQ984_16790 [Clostridium pasteurianum]ELP58963.1 cell wall hydrolase/autolysin [Clostridium pasteurianum DSM 525 = ATCC 6013]
MIISYDFGHMANGADTSANGIVYEYAEIRRYAPVAIQVLEQAGHKCINCTPIQSGISLNESLAYRVNKANASGSQLHLCFHINAFDGSVHGAEVEIASDAGARYGESVLTEICKLGFTRRGVNRPSLYVTKHTNMTAILIEPFFCDNAEDCKIYNPVTLGNAIAKGVLNVIGGNYKPLDNGAFAPQQININNIQGSVSMNPIRMGENSPRVRLLQSILSVLIGGISIDGDFGQGTYNAVVRYQKIMGISADGIVGNQTIDTLLNDLRHGWFKA